jgi:membrane associated rhomboid family serine protease
MINILLIVIVLTSIGAWRDGNLQSKLIFSPYQIIRTNEYYRFVSSGFIHADYGHLIFNCLSLYLFGDQLSAVFQQDFFFGKYGALVLVGIFILGVIIADIPTFIKHKDNPYYKSLGASGGVSSIVFASILIFPTSKIYMMFIPMGIPAFIFGILYLMYSYYMSQKEGDNINHSAHFIGSVFGVVAMLLLKPELGEMFIREIAAWF